MPSRQTLKDDKHHIVGYIDVDDRTGRQTLLSARYRKLGYYHPGDNETLDEHFRRVGTGNLLTILLQDVGR